MSNINPNQNIVIEINLKRKPTKQLTTRNLLTMPLAMNEVDSDDLRTPVPRFTGLSEKVMIRSETVPTEIMEKDAPDILSPVHPSRSLRQLLQSNTFRNIQEDVEK